MKIDIDYGKIQQMYHDKGDRCEAEFCLNAGINADSYRSRKAKGSAMNLLVALLIAEYLECNIEDFAAVNWK